MFEQPYRFRRQTNGQASSNDENENSHKHVQKRHVPGAQFTLPLIVIIFRGFADVAQFSRASRAAHDVLGPVAVLEMLRRREAPVRVLFGAWAIVALDTLSAILKISGTALRII